MRLLGQILLVAVLGTMFLSLFHISAGMDMTGGMSDCPFMSHTEVICPMNLTDHLEAWKSVFIATVPASCLILAVAGMAIFVVSVAPNLLRKLHYKSLLLYKWLEIRTYTFSYRPLQELFSSGILHPKLH